MDNEFNTDGARFSRSCLGFTLVEVLIVVAIIVILIAILVPVTQKAISLAQRTQCGANEHDIFVAITYFREDNKRFNADKTQGGRWYWPSPDEDPNMYAARAQEEGPYAAALELGVIGGDEADTRWIRANHHQAYWGVAYVAYADNSREIFKCPTAYAADAWLTDSEHQRSADGNQAFHTYNTYGFNGGGGGNGAPAGHANPHFIGNSGAKLARDKTPATTMVFMDGFESMMDNNGDMPNLINNNVLYWGGPYGIKEYWRHNDASMYQFNDGHNEIIEPTTDEINQPKTPPMKYPSLGTNMFYQQQKP